MIINVSGRYKRSKRAHKGPSRKGRGFEALEGRGTP
jgi:hypothetical protein